MTKSIVIIMHSIHEHEICAFRFAHLDMLPMNAQSHMCGISEAARQRNGCEYVANIGPASAIQTSTYMYSVKRGTSWHSETTDLRSIVGPTS